MFALLLEFLLFATDVEMVSKKTLKLVMMVTLLMETDVHQLVQLSPLQFAQLITHLYVMFVEMESSRMLKYAMMEITITWMDAQAHVQQLKQTTFVIQCLIQMFATNAEMESFNIWRHVMMEIMQMEMVVPRHVRLRLILTVILHSQVVLFVETEIGKLLCTLKHVTMET